MSIFLEEIVPPSPMEGCKCFKAKNPYRFYCWVPKVLCEGEENFFQVLGQEAEKLFKKKRIAKKYITAVFIPLATPGHYDTIKVCCDGKKKEYSFRWKYSSL